MTSDNLRIYPTFYPQNTGPVVGRGIFLREGFTIFLPHDFKKLKQIEVKFFSADAQQKSAEIQPPKFNVFADLSNIGQTFIPGERLEEIPPIAKFKKGTGSVVDINLNDFVLNRLLEAFRDQIMMPAFRYELIRMFADKGYRLAAVDQLVQADALDALFAVLVLRLDYNDFNNLPLGYQMDVLWNLIMRNCLP